MTKLDYQSVPLPEGIRGISPSQINNFFAKPHEWYRSEILKEKQFEGSTASGLGTVVHYIAEEFAKTRTVDKAEIPKYLEQFKDNPDINLDYIQSQWQPMGQALINYLVSNGLPERSEEPISYEVTEGVHVAGTADAVKGSCLCDYKTTSDLTAKDYIPTYYRYQLLTYAWIYNKLGIYIDRIRIIWITNHVVGRISDKTNKPMKDYPSTVTAVTEVITQEDLDFIESILKLIAETMYYSEQYPELNYIFFKDYRLKG